MQVFEVSYHDDNGQELKYTKEIGGNSNFELLTILTDIIGYLSEY